MQFPALPRRLPYFGQTTPHVLSTVWSASFALTGRKRFEKRDPFSNRRFVPRHQEGRRADAVYRDRAQESGPELFVGRSEQETPLRHVDEFLRNRRPQRNADGGIVSLAGREKNRVVKPRMSRRLLE